MELVSFNRHSHVHAPPEVFDRRGLPDLSIHKLESDAITEIIGSSLGISFWRAEGAPETNLAYACRPARPVLGEGFDRDER